MKALRKITHCSRCGDLLSRHEKRHTESAGLCAFCDQIRSEALQIYQETHADKGDQRRLRLV